MSNIRNISCFFPQHIFCNKKVAYHFLFNHSFFDDFKKFSKKPLWGPEVNMCIWLGNLSVLFLALHFHCRICVFPLRIDAQRAKYYSNSSPPSRDADPCVGVWVLALALLKQSVLRRIEGSEAQFTRVSPGPKGRGPISDADASTGQRGRQSELIS